MSSPPLAAVVLAGGRGRRLGGVDKAAVRIGDRTLLELALAAVVGCDPLVVVGPPGRPVPGILRVQEDPPYGGPAAGLLTALDALPPSTARVVVVAVDLPGLTAATVARLERAGRDGDGAVLVDATGRHQPALVLTAAALRSAAPPRSDWDGLSLHRLLAGVRLHEVPARPGEADDVDTPEDLARLEPGAST